MLTIVTRFTLSTLAATRIIRSLKGESESHELLRTSHRRARRPGTRREQKREGEKMKEKQVKLPGPDHPISIERNPARVVVSVAGRVVADTRNALTLREAAYPPVQYIPGEDVDF